MSDQQVVANQKKVLGHQSSILKNQKTIIANQAIIRKNQGSLRQYSRESERDPPQPESDSGCFKEATAHS